MNSPQAFLPPPARLLVRAVNWLGDAVMTLPAIQRLRESFPDALIAVLTTQKLEELWRLHPAVNEVISFPASAGPWCVSRRIRERRFDTALILPNSPRSALEVWLARIPARVGYRRPWRNWFLTHAVPARAGAIPMRKRSASEVHALADRAGAARSSYPPSAHQVNEYLNLAAQFGADPRPVGPHLAIPGPELDEARKALRQMLGKMVPGATREPIFFGMNPGAEYGPAKRWPAVNFAAVAREIALLAPDAIWLLFGGRGDAEICAEVARNASARVLNLAGRTSLRELCQYLKLCRLLLTNDTGPMHIAAALGTPVVVPFGSTSPELTGPGLPGDPSHRLILSSAPCAPCFLRACPIDFRCMHGISVERVARAAAEILGRG